MKRIIDGKAYNTATAQLLYKTSFNTTEARWWFINEDQEIPGDVTQSLYRTKSGAFFFVEEKVLFIGDNRDERYITEFDVATYDEAYAFVRTLDPGELLVNGIFPMIRVRVLP